VETTSETPTAQSWYGSNNQVANWGYDAAGNVTSIPGVQRTATYDAENRQVTAGMGSSSGSYAYDGDGRRVQKVTSSGTTTYVYDAMGQLAAEYGPPSDSGTSYLTADALGSTRLVMDPSGPKCYDYLPFGSEISGNLSGRPSCYGTAMYPMSSPDVVSEKFTAKERDAETGLDFFGARYFSGAQGRFTSPDEAFADQGPWDPQSWNLYSYVRNNPFRFTDADGRECVTLDNGATGDNGKGSVCQAVVDADKKKKPDITVAGNRYGSSYAFDYLGNYIQGSFRPPSAKETAIHDDTVNLAVNLSLIGDAAKVGVLVGTAGRDVIAALVSARNAILAGSFDQTAIRAGFQVLRAGGAAQAAKDFDSLVSATGAQVRTYGPVKSATLADGSEAVLRTSTTKGYAGTPTLELQDKVGIVAVRIRY
jgi:RHS repeat-associated protein